MRLVAARGRGLYRAAEVQLAQAARQPGGDGAGGSRGLGGSAAAAAVRCWSRAAAGGLPWEAGIVGLGAAGGTGHFCPLRLRAGSVPLLECPKQSVLWGNCSPKTKGVSSSLIAASLLLGASVKIARAPRQEVLPVESSLVYAKKSWVEVCVPYFCTHFSCISFDFVLKQIVL